MKFGTYFIYSAFIFLVVTRDHHGPIVQSVILDKLFFENYFPSIKEMNACDIYALYCIYTKHHRRMLCTRFSFLFFFK